MGAIFHRLGFVLGLIRPKRRVLIEDGSGICPMRRGSLFERCAPGWLTADYRKSALQ